VEWGFKKHIELHHFLSAWPALRGEPGLGGHRSAHAGHETDEAHVTEKTVTGAETPRDQERPCPHQRHVPQDPYDRSPSLLLHDQLQAQIAPSVHAVI
jgi:hypothetical protein